MSAKKVTISKSDKAGKKLMAKFTTDTGRVKTTHFGSAGMDDYTKTKDKDQRRRYRQRHKKDLLTKDPTRAGYLAYHILWGASTNLKENITSYKKRYGFK